MAGEAYWPPLGHNEARAILAPDDRVLMHAYRGHPLHLYIDPQYVYGAGYDSCGFKFDCATIVTGLRHLDRMDRPKSSPTSRIRATAAPFVPRCPPPLQRTLSSSSTTTTITPPTPMLQNISSPEPQITVPGRLVLQERLGCLPGSPWFHHTLVPKLLTAADKQMTPAAFLNFYYLNVSLAADEGDRIDVRPFLRPYNNPVVPAMVPNEMACRRVLERMAIAEAEAHNGPIAPPEGL